MDRLLVLSEPAGLLTDFIQDTFCLVKYNSLVRDGPRVHHRESGHWHSTNIRVYQLTKYGCITDPIVAFKGRLWK